MDRPVVVPFPVEVTQAELPALQAAADAALGPVGTRLVVDLSGTEFLGSGALGLLVRLGKRLHERGGGLALARARAPVERLLHAVGLESVLPHFSGVQAAVDHLTGRRP
jgi:anti-anti-sigma factor